jgi:hypothetical protein
MKRILRLTLFGALLAMSSVCANASDHAPDVVARVSVLATGKLLLNGSPTDLMELDKEFQSLKANGGSVLYYREAGQSEPPPEAMSVIELVVKYKLPVSMSTKADFSDYVDENGQPHEREP